VFGNMGETSATGVAFTRDPSTGEKQYYGEWLANAQGEDVVAGIRTPHYLTKGKREAAGAEKPSMEEAMPEAFAELAYTFELLERHYADMQDIEFTVQQGKLWMLQTRSGKRTAKAALRMAVDMVAEGLIDEETAIRRVDPTPRRRATCSPVRSPPRRVRQAAGSRSTATPPKSGRMPARR
jgi:pyruvate,orthophosphate dikinase